MPEENPTPPEETPKPDKPEKPEKTEAQKQKEEQEAGFKKHAEERAAEGEKTKEQKFSARDYFGSMGLNPRIARNDFSANDAIEVFAKAKDALKQQETTKETISGILDKAWEILRILT